MSGRTGGVPKEVLDDIVRRIVEVAAPEKIILFGSAARGELGPNSDIDLLVIKGGEYDRGVLPSRSTCACTGPELR
jgi:predicted nucleotidyltransferase